MSDTPPLVPRGRPKTGARRDPYAGTGYTVEAHRTLVAWFASGHKLDVALRAANVSRHRWYAWSRRADEGLEPFVTLMREIDTAQTRIEDVLLKTVLRGALPNEKDGKPGDPALALKLLGVLYPERYSERHNVAIAVGVDARVAELWRTLEAALPPDQLASVARAAAALSPGPTPSGDGNFVPEPLGAVRRVPKSAPGKAGNPNPTSPGKPPRVAPVPRPPVRRDG